MVFQVVLYCDLHGHSRKHNVFMYGNNTATDDPDNVNNNGNGSNNNSNSNGSNGVVNARAFLNERLFPWLMAQKVCRLSTVTESFLYKDTVEIINFLRNHLFLFIFLKTTFFWGI